MKRKGRRKKKSRAKRERIVKGLLTSIILFLWETFHHWDQEKKNRYWVVVSLSIFLNEIFELHEKFWTLDFFSTRSKYFFFSVFFLNFFATTNYEYSQFADSCSIRTYFTVHVHLKALTGHFKSNALIRDFEILFFI